MRLLSIAILLLAAARLAAQPTPRTAANNRDCASCHLDWVDSFNRPGAILLMDRPTRPAVSEEETCLGCHDGGVADDRKLVWQQHGHKTNVAPPPDIHVPDRLPLRDGKLACVTCHTAHANPDREGLTNTIFLRMFNDNGELCQQCHTDKTRGPQHGTHPLGPMKLALPTELAAQGARAGKDNKTLTCQSCHRPHGSSQEHLLVLGTRSSELCLSCHEQIRPEMWQKQVAGAHPLNPPLTTETRRKAIQDMGTQVGPNDSMICLSCHKLHKGLPDQHLLADTLQDSRLCLRCHEDRKSLAGSPHDLRKSAPTEKNALGLTPIQSGQCGACHTFHTYMRQPVVGAADPDGRCMTCHASGKVAQKAGGAAFGHPVVLDNKDLPRALSLRLNPGPGHEDNKTLECLTCHNPHETKRPKFLRAGRDALCGTCHADKLQSLASDHDFTANPLLHNGLGKSVSETGKCGFCHDVHHGNGPDLWTATNAKPTSIDDLCIQCHRSGGLAAKKPAFSYSHPTGPGSKRTTSIAVSLPLFDESAHRSATGFVACASCHDPHGNKQTSSALLRVSGTTSDLCLKCHCDKQSLVSGPHDQNVAMKPWPARAKADTYPNDACMGCHRPHGNNPVNRLWAVAPAASSVGGDGVCIACHQERHWSSEGALGGGNMIHPRILDNASSTAIAARASGLPLGFDPFAATTNLTIMPPHVLGPPAPLELARVSGDTATHATPNAIACKTCHDPHTDRNSLHLLRVAHGKGPEDVCLNCHKDVAPLAHGMHRLDNPAIDALIPLPTKGETSASDLVAGSPSEHPITGPPVPRSLFGPTCGPCHAVHAIETSDRKFLWAAPRSRAGANESDERCLGCHGPGGGAKKPEVFEHPAAAFASLKYAAGPKAPTDPVTLFSCSTCHLPHGQELPGVEKLTAGSDGDAFIASARPMVRDRVSQTVCSVCHGADARRVFMYYHQPGQRDAATALAAPR